jgi:hypothetical protein
MNFPETLAILGTKDTGRRQTKQKLKKNKPVSFIMDDINRWERNLARTRTVQNS